jgi:hypothetical protein
MSTVGPEDMSTIYVTPATAARVAELLDAEPFLGTDSLVQLALDAYRILAAPDVPAVSDASLLPAVWRERRRKVLDGSHYAEFAS